MGIPIRGSDEAADPLEKKIRVLFDRLYSAPPELNYQDERIFRAALEDLNGRTYRKVIDMLDEKLATTPLLSPGLSDRRRPDGP